MTEMDDGEYGEEGEGVEDYDEDDGMIEMDEEQQ